MCVCVEPPPCQLTAWWGCGAERKPLGYHQHAETGLESGGNTSGNVLLKNNQRGLPCCCITYSAVYRDTFHFWVNMSCIFFLQSVFSSWRTSHKRLLLAFLYLTRRPVRKGCLSFFLPPLFCTSVCLCWTTLSNGHFSSTLSTPSPNQYSLYKQNV